MRTRVGPGWGYCEQSVDARFSQLPRALAERTVFALASPTGSPAADGIPLLLAHPELGWNLPEGPQPSPRPVVLWLHGRTVSKELDPGRYLRWLRAEGGDGGGLAVCAIDLPGHGERLWREAQGSDRTLEVALQAVGEVDSVLRFLAETRWNGAFDVTRMAIGGMSAGGMVALTRLCAPHRFLCASVESTAGNFDQMRTHTAFYTRGGRDPNGELARRLNPAARLDHWRPIPLLALHSEMDQMVPVESIRSFTTALKARYEREGADPSLVELATWPETGAPAEHAGFGRVTNEAKNLQTAFFVRRLMGGGE